MANSLLHMNGVVWEKDNSRAPGDYRLLHLSRPVGRSLVERAFDKLGDGLIYLGTKLKGSHKLSSTALVSRI